MRRTTRAVALCLPLLAAGDGRARGASGTEGAAFLEIPTGARPAALGSAYGALADDAYAPLWNPAGAAFAVPAQVALTHLAYVETMSYEQASYAQTFAGRHGVGAAVQYLSPGRIDQLDAAGNGTGSFTGRLAAYSLSYAFRPLDSLSVGAAGRLVEEDLAGVGAKAKVFDAGALWRGGPLSLSFVAGPFGQSLTFLQQGDPPPTAYRAGAGLRLGSDWTAAVEGMRARAGGLTAARFGLERRVARVLALRAGYRTETVKQNSALAGATAGVGLAVWGQSVDYAWASLGDLGQTHYVTVKFRFGKEPGETP